MAPKLEQFEPGDILCHLNSTSFAGARYLTNKRIKYIRSGYLWSQVVCSNASWLYAPTLTLNRCSPGDTAVLLNTDNISIPQPTPRECFFAIPNNNVLIESPAFVAGRIFCVDEVAGEVVRSVQMPDTHLLLCTERIAIDMDLVRTTKNALIKARGAET